MGYRSDIRFLVPVEDYAKLKGNCLTKYGDYSYFNCLDKEAVRKCEDGKEFMYFGWNCINWYTNLSESDYQELDDIEDAVMEFEQYQVVRIGEGYEDIKDDWNLGDTCIESIGIIRAFDEQKEK